MTWFGFASVGSSPTWRMMALVCGNTTCGASGMMLGVRQRGLPGGHQNSASRYVLVRCRVRSITASATRTLCARRAGIWKPRLLPPPLPQGGGASLWTRTLRADSLDEVHRVTAGRRTDQLRYAVAGDVLEAERVEA